METMSISSRFSSYLVHKISSFAATDGAILATELDSHADSPVIGRNAAILEVFSQIAMV